MDVTFHYFRTFYIKHHVSSIRINLKLADVFFVVEDDINDIPVDIIVTHQNGKITDVIRKGINEISFLLLPRSASCENSNLAHLLVHAFVEQSLVRSDLVPFLCLNESLDILRQNVRFDIDLIAYPAFPQRGDS